jgi:uncharacterized protein (TIGR03437 family)
LIGTLPRAFETSAQTREVRIVNVTNALSGQVIQVPIDLVAQGNEAAVGFTVTFNPLVLGGPVAAVGAGVPGATIFVNTNEASTGKVGITLAMPIGQSIAAGTQRIVNLSFTVSSAATAGATPIAFGDQPVRREISDGNANAVTATFTSGTVTIVQPNPLPVLSAINPATAVAGGPAFTLTVTGMGFIASSTVRVRGANRPTTVVSATQLTAEITAADIEQAGSAAITVQNPSPGGGISNELSLAINNPVPTLSVLTPSSATAGTNGIAVTVTGTNFVASSKVRWKGEDRATTFVSATQLTAQLTAADLAVLGTAAVTVFTPAPGGGTSNTVNFTVTNPAPVITTLQPAAAVVGGLAFTLTVSGTGFVSNSMIEWNEAAQATAFVNVTTLTAQIPATLIASTGTARVRVVTPAPGGGASSVVNFGITNPLPTLTSLTPSSANAGGAAFNLTVTGTNFRSDSVIRWNDADRTTTFVSATELRAAIPAADIASPGIAAVKVFTPAPGGGTTAGLSFIVSGSLANVSAASFLGEQLATESIIAAFGVNLATRTEVAATVPLPTTLAGTTLKVKDSAGVERAAPLFFVAGSQINYQMPASTAAGSAMITVMTEDNKTSIGAAVIANVAPGLFSANANGQGVAAATLLRVKPNGDQIFEPISRFDSGANRFVSLPLDLGPTEDQVFLVVFGSGFRFRTGLTAVTASIGGTSSEVLYAGPTPGLVGLDQGNIRIPRSLAGRGDIDLILTVDGKPANTVRVNFK